MKLDSDLAEKYELKNFLRRAEILHEHLRNYGQLSDDEKPLIVSAILLALSEGENFNLEQLTGDKVKTDGEKIFEHAENYLNRAKICPEVKKERVLNQFRLIKDRPSLNTVNLNLNMTPIKFFTEFISKNIFNAVINNSSEDYLGKFYGEFISYSGGDAQSLGIVLTPRHISELFCDLVDLKPDDIVFDPCCGTGSFLIAAMSHMLANADEFQRKNIKQRQIFGIEAREDMFAIATTNMILRGDGQSNLICGDFFAHDAKNLQINGATVGFMNPPYSQAKNLATSHLSELNFTFHLLNSIKRGGRAAVIVPVSAMIGKNQDDRTTKSDILKNHTLEGVITLSKNTFYRVGTVPCIAIFTAGEPHNSNKLVKFINFADDGFKIKKHFGLVETEHSKDKKIYLLDCWRGKISDVPSKFMIKAKIEPQDEWLHSFYYQNNELPTENDFNNTVAEYLTFEFNMIAHGHKNLFPNKKIFLPTIKTPPLEAKNWKEFLISDLFELESGKCSKANRLKPYKNGIPYIGATNRNNGVLNFVRPVKNLIQNGNCIAFIKQGEGSVGYSVYKQENFIASTGIACGYAPFLNKYVGMFITTVADRIRGKYNYNYPRSERRLRKERLKLPVNDTGAPDFHYMENYMRNIEEKILQSYRDLISEVMLPPPPEIFR